MEEAAAVFGSNAQTRSSNSDNADIDKLHATIGRLKVENDFLQRRSAKLNL